MYFYLSSIFSSSFSSALLCCAAAETVSNFREKRKEKKLKNEKAPLPLNNGLYIERETFLLNSSFCTSNAAVFSLFIWSS